MIMIMMIHDDKNHDDYDADHSDDGVHAADDDNDVSHDGYDFYASNVESTIMYDALLIIIQEENVCSYSHADLQT